MSAVLIVDARACSCTCVRHVIRLHAKSKDDGGGWWRWRRRWRRSSSFVSPLSPLKACRSPPKQFSRRARAFSLARLLAAATAFAAAAAKSALASSTSWLSPLQQPALLSVNNECLVYQNECEKESERGRRKKLRKKESERNEFFKCKPTHISSISAFV